MAPRLGPVRPASRRRIVDLPQPDGPSSDRNSPRLISRSTPLNASVPLANVLLTPPRRTSGGSGRSTTSIALRIAIDIVIRLYPGADRSRPGPVVGPITRAPDILFARSLRPQIEPDALVDELQGIGLLVVEPRLDDARLDHLVVERLDPLVGHRAHAELQRVAGIDQAVFLDLGDRKGDLLIRHV